MFRIEYDIAALTRRFSDLERRQIPFALAGALNDTAFQTREKWKEIVRSKIDRPTPYTANSVLYTKATKQNALSAEIYIKDEGRLPPVKYLIQLEEGGARGAKPAERALRLSGATGGKFFYVPGSAVKLDRFGNVPRSTIVQILASARAFTQEGFASNETQESRRR